MSESVQVTIAFILYVFLFGWIGYRRGTLRELIVFLIAVGGFFGLQRIQGLILNLINLGGKFLAFARAGGLNGNNDAFSALVNTPDWVSQSDGPTVVFLIWAALLLITYVITNSLIPDAKSSRDMVAIVIGVLNGLFYITVFLPLLVAFVMPDAVAEPAPPSADRVQQVLRNTAEALAGNFGDFWAAVEPQQPILAAILLTVLLVAVAGTLRRSRA